MARAAKRVRHNEAAETDSNNNASPPDKHTLFTDWSRSRGVEIGSVAPQSLPGRGIGLVTTAPVKAGERLLFIPEKAMYKPDNALIKRSGLERASPQAKLAVSVMASFAAPESELSVWSATWPTREDFEASMPLCWPEDLTENLPPAVLAPLERQRADYAKDRAAVGTLCGGRGWSEREFRYYWCVVNSRSFHWKPSQKGRAGSMVLCPFIDYTNHGPTGSGCRVEQGGQGYEGIADRDYAAGEEILFTYGAHSNDKLLVHYGFVNASTKQHASPDDEIRLDHIVLPHLSEHTKSQLQDVGFLGAYALLPSSYHAADGDCGDECLQPWEICFKTQVAIRAAILTCNEWEYFVTNGEDLSSDKSSLVRAWLLPHLRKYHEQMVEKVRPEEYLRAFTLSAYPVGVGLLKTRWEQIRDAVSNYIQHGK